jgi:hypothetical protein
VHCNCVSHLFAHFGELLAGLALVGFDVDLLVHVLHLRGRQKRPGSAMNSINTLAVADFMVLLAESFARNWTEPSSHVQVFRCAWQASLYTEQDLQP